MCQLLLLCAFNGKCQHYQPFVQLQFTTEMLSIVTEMSQLKTTKLEESDESRI